jgi:hypothetical protein
VAPRNGIGREMTLQAALAASTRHFAGVTLHLTIPAIFGRSRPAVRQKAQLVRLLQERYGYARERAEQEVDQRLREYQGKAEGIASSVADRAGEIGALRDLHRLRSLSPDALA